MINWFTITVTYLLIWWVVIFLTLPFGAKLPEEVGEGHSQGAPARTHLLVKALVTTVVAALLTWLFFVVTSGLLVNPH